MSVIGLVLGAGELLGGAGCASQSASTRDANNGKRPIRRRPTFPNAGGGPVLVTGHVKQPCFVPWFRGMGIRFAVAVCGGALPSLDPTIEIRRRELGEERKAFTQFRDESEPEFELAPGDVVVLNAIIDPEEVEPDDFTIDSAQTPTVTFTR